MSEVTLAPLYERLFINQWTRPMHLFVGDADDALCGISVEVANNQGGNSYDGEVFPAEDNHTSLKALMRDWHGDAYCGECLDGLVELLRADSTEDSDE